MRADSVGEFLRAYSREVWNEKLTGRVEHYYGSNVIVHLSSGETKHGSDQVLADIVAWLAAFPDARVFLDDVIWSAGPGEYRTSVRETMVGRNTGPSQYGPPSGRRVVVSRIVNSRLHNDRFVEQWIEWDEIGLLRQLRLDERQFAMDREDASLESGVGDGLSPGVTGWEHGRMDSSLLDIGENLESEDLVRTAVAAVWNARLPGAVSRFYAEDYRASLPGRRIFGPEEVQGEVLMMLAAFPDLHLHVDDVLCREDHDGAHTSTRWTLLGTNTGPSHFAPPSNRYVRLTGITHHRIRDFRLQEGWTEYSELSLLRQIAPPPETARNENGDE